MTNRRQMIGAGLALAALPVLGGAISEPQRTGPAPIRIDRLLIDPRFPDALSMAAHFNASESAVTALQRDVLDLWHDDLLPAMTDGRMESIAGITSETAAFLIRTLAADQRFRVLYRAAHGPAFNGAMHHVISGPDRTVSSLVERAAKHDWRLPFAQALGSCAATGRCLQGAVLTAADRSDPRSETLVSWIIVPRCSSTG
jgi:hypothetical protein